MAATEKCQTNINLALKSVILLFSLLHIITISFCGYLLYDGMQMKKELDACKSTIKLSGLSKGQAAQQEPIATFSQSNMSIKISATDKSEKLVGGSTTRQKRQSRTGQPGQGPATCSCDCGDGRSGSNVRGPGRSPVGERSGISSCRGLRGHPGSPGPRGPKGDAGIDGTPRVATSTSISLDKAAPGFSEESGIDVTFIHWGKFGCSVGDRLYSGYAVGSNSGSPICAPRPNEILSSSTSLPSGPRLTALKYNLQGAPNQLNLAARHNQIVRCAFCHAQRNETFTVVGQTHCFSSRTWSTIYSGYLMAAESADGSTFSEPICVDRVPDRPESLQTDTQTQGLRLVRSGKGVWSENNLVTCAVCTKNSGP